MSLAGERVDHYRIVGVIGAGLLVVTLRNIIHSAVAMMVCFGSLAGMYALLGAPIVAAAQVLIYLGAISVLILFAIMLTQTKDAPSRLVFQTQAGPASIAAIVVAILIALAVSATDWGKIERGARLGTEIMSRILFQQFLFPFEIVSVLLLAAVIGGVFLAKQERSPDPAEPAPSILERQRRPADLAASATPVSPSVASAAQAEQP